MMAHTIVDNLGDLKIIWGNEVNLHYEDRWAGSTDVVGVYDNKPTIIDFKQSNKPKREEYVEDYYYQIAAYSLAHKKIMVLLNKDSYLFVRKIYSIKNLKWTLRC